MDSPKYKAELRARQSYERLIGLRQEYEAAERAHMDTLQELGRDSVVWWAGSRCTLAYFDYSVGLVALNTAWGRKLVAASAVKPDCPDRVCEQCGIEMGGDFPLDEDVCMACRDAREEGSCHDGL